MYNTTAFLYESIAAFENPEMVCRQIQGLLAGVGMEPPGVLGDLGSGTGLMSVLFAEQGWQVEGLELSAAMISVARKKAGQLPLQVQERLSWLQGDISHFELPESNGWDVALCLCNTLNHLAEWHQVLSFIQSVTYALKTGGVLILDTDTLETFQRFFHHGPVVVWDDGVHRLTRACEFHSATRRAYHTATLEQHTPNGLALLSVEPMTLSYHRETDLFVAFEQAGFQLLQSIPFNPYPTLYKDFVPKLLWVLRKC